jgi:integrase
VALYVADLADTHKPSTIARRMAAIAFAHHSSDLPTPTADVLVREVLRGLRREKGVARDEAAPVGIGEIQRMVALLPDTMMGLRDRAVLLVGFASALRRSELVALDVVDVEAQGRDRVLRIRRSKTDQEGEGRRVALSHGRHAYTCPVRALDAWVVAAGVEEGPVFRAVDRHGNVSASRLTGASISHIVKRTCDAAGLDPARYSGHSLRAGFATTAAANGRSEASIANQTGHRSMEILRRYIRHGSVFTDNAATDLGL